eukprot:2545-Heterococcus_DN1.PRE.2
MVVAVCMDYTTLVIWYCALHCAAVHYTTDAFFGEQGYSVLDWLYTANVSGVTSGLVDTSKLQAVLRAANMLGITSLIDAAVQHAAVCGVTVETQQSSCMDLTGYSSSSAASSSAVRAVDVKALAVKFARQVRELKLEIRHRDSLLALHAKAAFSMQDTSSSSSSSRSSAALLKRSVVLLRLTDTTAGDMTAVTHVLDTELLARLYNVLEDDDGDVLLEKLAINTHAISAVHQLTCNGTCTGTHCHVSFALCEATMHASL